jgi:enoyl-CoA hydratase
MTDEVLLQKSGSCGHIVLNRPQALNALTLTMVRAMDPVLRQWAEDPTITHVFIEGAGEKGFCAGGDIRALHDWGKAGDSEATGFYREEYVVNTMIKRFPKPYIALMDGVTMGGGVGVSVHGSARIVTDRTVFAMPETGIGLLPDVGGTYFLPRLKGQIGTYMALTGARLKAADCLYAGIATHYAALDDLEALRQSILTSDDVTSILDGLATNLAAAPLAAMQGDIDRLFAADQVGAILRDLDTDGGDWAAAQAATIRQKSPTSCGVALRQCREGIKNEFEECMRMEMRAVTRIMSQHDFYEGVRAVIIDKDQAPKWQPDSFEAVSEAVLDEIFANLGEHELSL